MRPCIGISGLCAPMCTWAELKDGSISLADVEMFHQALDEIMADYQSRTAK